MGTSGQWLYPTPSRSARVGCDGPHRKEHEEASSRREVASRSRTSSFLTNVGGQEVGARKGLTHTVLYACANAHHTHASIIRYDQDITFEELTHAHIEVDA